VPRLLVRRPRRRGRRAGGRLIEAQRDDRDDQAERAQRRQPSAPVRQGLRVAPGATLVRAVCLDVLSSFGGCIRPSR
jgi:hypothetical protein